MRIKHYGTILILLTAAGCATYGALEKDYGNSYNGALSGQILNPGASRNPKPVTGLPGDVEEVVMQKYVQSFSQDPKKATQKQQTAPGVPLGMTGGYDAHEKQ